MYTKIGSVYLRGEPPRESERRLNIYRASATSNLTEQTLTIQSALQRTYSLKRVKAGRTTLSGGVVVGKLIDTSSI
ncbi:MAG: hypothetical protein JWR59_2503 [Brevundimonas sp.]|nr:hypothetical protein [Brevundimonas sp.]